VRGRLTAMHTTETAEGTATRGLLKCFWASRKPSAELCREEPEANNNGSSL